MHAKRRIFLCQALQGEAHFLLIDLGLGFDGHRDDGFRELHLFQDDDMLGIRQGVAGGDVLQAHRRRAVAGADFLDFGTFARMHLQQATDALVAIPVGHEHLIARIQRARIDTEKGEIADERVVQNLEGQRRKRLAVVRFAGHRLATLALALDGRHFRGGRHVLDDGIEYRLHALVLEGRAARHQAHFVLERPSTQALLDLGVGELAGLQILGEQSLATLGGGLDHLGAPLLALLEHAGRDVAIFELHALRLFIPPDRLHLDEVDHAGEAVLGSHGQLNGHRVAPQTRSNLVHAAQEVRAGAVHLVDEGDAGYAIFVHLAPDGLRLRLHARYGAIDRNGGIQHAEAALHFDGEIDVSRGIDDIDAMFREALVHSLPETSGRRGGNGDAALLLLLHVVHDGGSVMHLADLVRHARVKQNTLRRGGFTRVDMSGNTDIPVSLYRRTSCHISYMSFADIPRRFAHIPRRFAHIPMRFAQPSTGPMRPRPCSLREHMHNHATHWSRRLTLYISPRRRITSRRAYQR